MYEARGLGRFVGEGGGFMYEGLSVSHLLTCGALFCGLA